MKETSQAFTSTSPYNLDVVSSSTAQDCEEQYAPPKAHWYFQNDVNNPNGWSPFSILDSNNLEEAFSMGQKEVWTDGGRYDADVNLRVKQAVYWDCLPIPLCRGTWFVKSEKTSAFLPYSEDVADRLEDLYRNSFFTGQWNHKLDFSSSESIVIHSKELFVQYTVTNNPDEWGVLPMETQIRPQTVRRGANDTFISCEPGESMIVDHLVFVVHGIGAFCDMKFRDLQQCLDDVRKISNELGKTHFKNLREEEKPGRVEFLPVSWHNSLHDEKIDKVFGNISLPSISWVRNFVNNSLMDILFYTSPLYCQNIIDKVCLQINKLYSLFIQRNTNFNGGVSLLGHSLGSVILFDLLAHQISTDIPDIACNAEGEKVKSLPNIEKIMSLLGLEDYLDVLHKEKMDEQTLLLCNEKDLRNLGIPLGPVKKLITFINKEKPSILQKQIQNGSILNKESIITTFGLAGTGQSYIHYPKIAFRPSIFFALGSPIAMFLAVRGFLKIDEQYQLPTCPKLLNIFHPFDPVAYRLETLINHQIQKPPLLIPHHKGRKRFHLELKENFFKVSNGIKNKIYDLLSATWNSLNGHVPVLSDYSWNSFNYYFIRENCIKAEESTEERSENGEKKNQTSLGTNMYGSLNQGERIDYVLQERPLEVLNEYIFALSSHTCYWESEDTILLILTQIYSLSGHKLATLNNDDSKLELKEKTLLE